jgi:predicted amidohydrolase
MAVTRVAVVQSAPALGDVAANLAGCLDALARSAAQRCDLVVFPECALSGYMFEDEQSARRCAEPIPGASTDALARACAQTGVHGVLGMLEVSEQVLYNAAVLIGPGGLLGRYRKTHIARIGADCFTTPGDEPYEVYDTAVGRIGLQICYDWRFPEITRVLAVRGADMVVNPTNSPMAARELADFLPRARATENAAFFVMANRCGREGVTSFFGCSQIADPVGNWLARAGGDESVISAALDLSLARSKCKEPGDGGYQVRLFDDRRPELYGPLSAGHPQAGHAYPAGPPDAVASMSQLLSDNDG